MRTALLALCAIAVMPRDAARAAEPPSGYVVIVNADVKARSVSSGLLRAMFAKKTTRWSDDTLVTPFDLAPTHPARTAFSERVHGKSPQAVLSEWRQRIFTGQGTPPRELKDETLMVAFVAATPGAIGYVPGGTPLPSHVRVLAVTE